MSNQSKGHKHTLLQVRHFATGHGQALSRHSHDLVTTQRMLRQLAVLGRSSEAAQQLAGSSGWACGHAFRAMATQPEMTGLDQYVNSIRKKIANMYTARIKKHQVYVATFDFVATNGLPRAHDFDGVKKLAIKRAQILRKVQFPTDWKVNAEQTAKIQTILDDIPAKRKTAAEKGETGMWYLKLTTEQVAECKKDPQLFVELTKVNEFEDKFNTLSQAQAAKFGLPPITLDELPTTMDPVHKHTISQDEVKWIVQKAKESAEEIKRTDPRFADPYNTKEFKAEQRRVADRLGISDEMLAKLQQDTPAEMWKQMSI